MKRMPFLFCVFIVVCCFLGCGDEEPQPVIPEGGGAGTIATDTTTEDSVATDTVAADSTKEDSVELVCFYDREYFEKFYTPAFRWTDGCPWGIYDMAGDRIPVDSVPVKYGMYRWRKWGEGLVAQEATLQLFFMRDLSFGLQPKPATGIVVGEANRHPEPLTLANEERNRRATGIRAEMDLPGECEIIGVDDGDTLGLVTYLPSASLLPEEPRVGLTLQGGIAGVSILPVGVIFSSQAEVHLCLPESVEDFPLKALSDDGWAVPAVADGDAVMWNVPCEAGSEWVLVVEARIVELTEEQLCLASAQTGHSVQNQDEHYRKLRYRTMIAEQKAVDYGFEAESAIGFVEERFLTALFGIHFRQNAYLPVPTNVPCTIDYSVYQTRYHITFEAGARRFKALVYGDPYLEILNVTPD